MNILYSPHDDDAHLFASFICLRERPVIVVVTDSWIQPNRGEVGCSAEERAAETIAAGKITGNWVERMGIPDSEFDEPSLYERFQTFELVMAPGDVVYAPAIQGGNSIHDAVGRAALAVFGDRVRQYTTYTKTELHTTGDIEIVPTPEELDLKAQALACYVSQLRINRPHFDAVMGKSEWLMA